AGSIYLAKKEQPVEFVLTRPQKEIQKAVREFARSKFEKEKVLELITTGQYPADIRKKAGELGFCGTHFPEEFEGAGLGLMEYVLVAEEMCRNDSSVGMGLLLSSFGAECLFRFGRSPLAAQYLPAVVSGKMRCGAAFFENHGDSDLSGVRSTAVNKKGSLAINGVKRCIANGQNADFYVLLCRTGTSQEGAEKNLSLVAVDAKADGVSVRPAGPTLGGSLTGFADAVFENVSVPETNVLGRPGSGLAHGLGFLDEARIQTAAMALGTAQGAFERAAAYVGQRSQFGRKLSEFQVIRHKLADIYARIDSARWSVYSAADAFDRGKCDHRTAASAKLNAAAAAMEASDEAIQLLGGYGYMAEYEVEHFYRDAKTLELFTGPPAALKDAISEGITGKAR
ncbi:MAG: acyl-CoA dehydrogenase family protein, partial [Desulfosalsimonas sp.]